jgi:hypothetical protein
MLRVIGGAFFLATLVCGCGRSATPTAPAPTATAKGSLELAGPRVGVGRTVQFKATADALDVTKLVTWTSSDPDVLTVSNTGEVSGKSEGTAVLTATYEGATGALSVQTSKCVGWSITGPKVIWLGQSVFWQTDAYDGCIPHWTSVSALFQSPDPNIVMVSTNVPRATVTITGVSPGSVTLTATGSTDLSASLKNTTATGTVTVLSTERPPPENLTITTSAGSALFAGLVTGQPKALKVTARWTTPINWDEDVTSSAVWSTSDPNTAAISTSGVITGLRPGTVEVSATYQGVSGTETIIVGSDHDVLTTASIDLHADVDPFGRDRFNWRVEYAYTLASASSGSVRIELWDAATAAKFNSASNVALRGAGASVLQGGAVTVPASIVTICGRLSLVPTSLTIDLGCKPAHVGPSALLRR